MSVSGKPETAVAGQDAAFATLIQELAQNNELPAAVWKPTPFQIPACMRFTADQDTLAVFVKPGTAADDVDRALVYGLAHAGSRRLKLVLPADRVEPTRLRLAGVRDLVDLFSFTGTVVTAIRPAALSEVVKALAEGADLRAGELKIQSEVSRWASELIKWADDSPHLSAAHRPTFQSWKCDGLQLLRIGRTKGGLEIRAGVDSTVSPDDIEHHFVLHATGPLSSQQTKLAQEAINRGIQERATGAYADNYREHRLQSVIKTDPSLLPAGPASELLREFPVRRPRGTGFIDFLYVDIQSRLHVVETKINASDEFVVVQGLDYWLWAKANLKALEDYFGKGQIVDVVIDFVLGEAKATEADPGAAILTSYAPALLRALSPEVPWEVHRVAAWQSGSPEWHAFGARTIPGRPHVKRSTVVGRYWLTDNIRRAIAWSTLANMASRHPAWAIVELHSGGGQYDELALRDTSDKDRGMLLKLNLAQGGSLHLGQGTTTWTSFWDDALRDNSADIATRLMNLVGCPADTVAPPPTARTLTYQVLAQVALDTTTTDVSLRIDSGYFDSSGEPCEPRPIARDFPAAAQRINTSEPDDIDREPHYRFWSISGPGKPGVLVETTGRFWTPAQYQGNLFEEYGGGEPIGQLAETLAMHLR